MSFFPVIAPSGTEATFSYLQTATSGSATTSYSFASQNLGTAATDRYIIAAVTTFEDGSGSGTITGVTIGGVTATQAAQAASSGTSPVTAALYIAAVPTGTTGTVVVTTSDACNRASISLYRATKLTSATPASTLTDTSVSANALSGTLAVQDGFVIAVAASDGGSGLTCTWTGVTENADDNYEFDSSLHAGSLQLTNTSAAYTVTATFSGTPDANRAAMAVAFWR
jgi:hypothetical protein